MKMYLVFSLRILLTIDCIKMACLNFLAQLNGISCWMIAQTFLYQLSITVYDTHKEKPRWILERMSWNRLVKNYIAGFKCNDLVLHGLQKQSPKLCGTYMLPFNLCGVVVGLFYIVWSYIKIELMEQTCSTLHKDINIKWKQ